MKKRESFNQRIDFRDCYSIQTPEFFVVTSLLTTEHLLCNKLGPSVCLKCSREHHVSIVFFSLLLFKFFYYADFSLRSHYAEIFLLGCSSYFYILDVVILVPFNMHVFFFGIKIYRIYTIVYVYVPTHNNRIS